MQIRSGLGFGEPLDPDLAVEDRGQVSAALLSVPATSRVDAAWWMPTNARTSRGASCAASPDKHDLLGDGQSTAPFAGQCGTAKPAPCSSANQAFWNRTNSCSLTPVWASRQLCGMAVHTTSARSRGTRPDRRSRVQTRKTAPPTRRVVSHEWRTTRAVAAAEAGCSATATTGWSRHRIRPRRVADDTPGRPPRRPRWPTFAVQERLRAPRAESRRHSTMRTWRESPARCVRLRRR